MTDRCGNLIVQTLEAASGAVLLKYEMPDWIDKSFPAFIIRESCAESVEVIICDFSF